MGEPVPHTSTYALTNATLPYILDVAVRGAAGAAHNDLAAADRDPNLVADDVPHIDHGAVQTYANEVLVAVEKTVVHLRRNDIFHVFTGYRVRHQRAHKQACKSRIAVGEVDIRITFRGAI